jgi:hypothetical protein
MFPCVCIECGAEFEAKTMFAKVCSSKCVQRRYRKTTKGKANVLLFNKRVKRKDIKKVCVHCKKDFITARIAQGLCSVCSIDRGAYYAQKKHRAKFPERARARDTLNKMQDERRVSKANLIKKEPCDVCGKDAEAHHHNYDKPLDVVWLCKEHHVMLEAI